MTQPNSVYYRAHAGSKTDRRTLEIMEDTSRKRELRRDEERCCWTGYASGEIRGLLEVWYRLNWRYL